MRLYDTLSRGLVELPPPPGPIRMYFCGQTVYARMHVGNAVPFVLSMWLKRWLQLSGYEVKLVINVTDINDKIYDAAPGASAKLAADATRWYVEDTNRLGLGRPDVEPTAVETVPDQIIMIEELIDRGAAYESGGDVYFRVGRFPEYGRLSRQKLDQMQEQEPNPRKEDPRDFALWKANKPGEDTSWESPWGRGRPGWHIECSAMSEKHLGTEFEIHGGGLDLVFPHHENEIAQSRSLDHVFAKTWMHNGMLRFRGEEMHKSLGNDIALRDVLDRWGRQTLLLFLLTGHWRKPLDYSDETMAAAAAQWRSFEEAWRVAAMRDSAPWDDFETALNDDFNTPKALSILHEWRAAGQTELLKRGLEVFGLLTEVSSTVGLPVGSTAPDVFVLAHKRAEARSRKDFAEADRLRQAIAELGFEVQDVQQEPGFRLIPIA